MRTTGERTGIQVTAVWSRGDLVDARYALLGQLDEVAAGGAWHALDTRLNRNVIVELESVQACSLPDLLANLERRPLATQIYDAGIDDTRSTLVQFVVRALPANSTPLDHEPYAVTARCSVADPNPLPVGDWLLDDRPRHRPQARWRGLRPKPA